MTPKDIHILIPDSLIMLSYMAHGKERMKVADGISVANQLTFRKGDCLVDSM